MLSINMPWFLGTLTGEFITRKTNGKRGSNEGKGETRYFNDTYVKYLWKFLRRKAMSYRCVNSPFLPVTWNWLWSRKLLCIASTGDENKTSTHLLDTQVSLVLIIM